MSRYFEMQWHDAPIDGLMEMIEQHWEPGNPMGSCLIDSETWACPAYKDYQSHAISLLAPLVPQGGKLMSYAVKMPASGGEEWAHGYPHNHGYAFHSMVTYLAVGDGRPLLIFDGDTEVQIVPEVGKSIVFLATLEHGVKGSDDEGRIALVTQSMPTHIQVH